MNILGLAVDTKQAKDKCDLEKNKTMNNLTNVPANFTYHVIMIAS